MSKLPIMLAGAFLALSQATHAYEEISVENGRTIQGRVTFEGQLPPDAVELINIQRNNDICDVDGTGLREVVWVDVNEDDALRGVFVYLDKIDAGKPWVIPEDGFVMLQKVCQFRPWAMVVKPGEVIFRHDDGDTVLHNVIVQELIGVERGRPIRKKMFDFAQTHSGDDHRQVVPARDPHLAVSCEAHIFMFGFMLAPEHPYAVVVDEDGVYSIEDVPPGQYVLKAWHPRFGIQQTSVSVSHDGDVSADFTFRH